MQPPVTQQIPLQTPLQTTQQTTQQTLQQQTLHQQTLHQQTGHQQTGIVGSSLQSSSSYYFGSGHQSQSQMGQAPTTSLWIPTDQPPCHSQAQSGHSLVNSDGSLVAQPLPPTPSAELPPGGVPAAVANLSNQPPYCVLPVGTTFYPILSSALSGFIKDKTGGTVGGPGQKVIMLGAPITSTTPTVVLDQHSDPPLKRKPGQPNDSSYHSLCHEITQTIAPSSLDPAVPKAFPWGGFPSRDGGHDVELPAGNRTQDPIQPVTEKPRPPTPPPSELPTPPPSGNSWRANQVKDQNPLLYQIILDSFSSSSSNPGEPLTSDPECKRPGPDPRGAPPSPEAPPPTTRTVKALADSACDVSSSQGPEERLRYPNIQENELSSTVSDPEPPEDGGEPSDTQGSNRPTYPGVQETTPASLLGGDMVPEPPAKPHGAGWAQTTGASAEDPAGPETPGEELVATQPPGEGDGRAAPVAQGPCSRRPVVSLFRLPLSVGAPGRPTPRYRLHAGDTEQEMFLEELMDDDLPRDEEQDSYLQPLSSPGSPEGLQAPGSLAVCACCHAPSCNVACSRCERSFHSACHVPPGPLPGALPGALSGREWVCSLCQDLSDPRDPYASERSYTPCLSLLEQRKCERVLLSLRCQLGDPTEALGLIQNRLCHLKNPPYRTSLELITDLQLGVDLHSPTEDGAPSLWERLQLTAMLGVDPDTSLRAPQQPASPPRDPGPSRGASREKKAAHRKDPPKKRSRVTGRDPRVDGSKPSKRRRRNK